MGGMRRLIPKHTDRLGVYEIMIPGLRLDAKKESLLSFDGLSSLYSLCNWVVERGVEGSFEHCVLDEG